MTDEEIKEVVRAYIGDMVLSDNADCLHERDEWYSQSGPLFAGSVSGDIERAQQFYRKAKVTVTFDEG